jgi:transmembrane sensor
VSDKPPTERRTWRTDQEAARLRERITASDPAAPVTRRAFVAGRTPWIVAAVAVLVVAAGTSWHAPRRPSSSTAAGPIERVATTGVGERLTIRLGDSSVITLGPVSTIRYSLSGKARSVAVDGIADFNVVHDTARPFRVRAKNAVVTDVGTEFVVRAYSADRGVDVSVTSGVVTVSGGTSDSVELRAGEVAYVARDGRAARVAGASALALAAWLRGHLVFDDVPLSTVAEELGRWFDVRIRIPDRQLAERRVSARYNQATLSGVLEALTTTLTVRYERVGNVVTILPAK